MIPEITVEINWSLPAKERDRHVQDKNLDLIACSKGARLDNESFLVQSGRVPDVSHVATLILSISCGFSPAEKIEVLYRLIPSPNLFSKSCKPLKCK